MRPGSPSKLILFLSLMVCGLACVSYADGLNNNEVEFTGSITSVVTNGDGTGTVFVQIAGVDLRVIVNAKTDVVDKNGDDLALASLKSGDIVGVEGKYSSSGIVASKLQLTANSNTEFDLRGHITALETSGSDLRISLLGISVLVTPTTKITSNGAVVAASDLKIGALVQVEGTTGPAWTATAIKVLTGEKQKGHVRFEGTVTALSAVVDNEQTIKVKVEGLTANETTVKIGPNTRVTGSLAEGVQVMVVGILNADLSVTATKIRVLAALEIKPDERKLKVGENATFTVKLRETAAANTTVALKSSDDTILSLTDSSVTVNEGTKTADFTVKALKTGTVVITAEALGQKATADVEVGEVSEDENERPAGETRIMFAPRKIRMGLNATRDVVLLIQPPQKADVSVKFVVSSVPNNVVEVAGQPGFAAGVSALKVTIGSGSTVGTASVSATLPQELGGAKAELLVEVSDKSRAANNDENTQIDFHPDEVKLDIGQTATVDLQTSATFDSDVTVALATRGSGKVVEVSAAVTIQAGKTVVQVPVKGIASGKVHVTAALPKELGGDTAKLDVEVKGK